MSTRITVFTPTYNRAYIIENLYRSLQKQTFTDFEWLVVDDGSTDDTKDLFARWQAEENPFPIRYYKKTNGGKHRAVNCGLDLAAGEIFFTMDSDDVLTADSLGKIDQWFCEIADDETLAGIAANKGFSETETVNHFFSASELDRSLLDMSTYQENGQYVLNGERAIAFYTDYHRKYRFPEFDGENFMTEAVVYNRMAADGKRMRFYNDIIWIYEYQADGLTRNSAKLFLNNPKGYGLYVRENEKIRHRSLPHRLLTYYGFMCDLSEMYDTSFIAESIGQPVFLIAMMRQLHDFRVNRRNRQENR